MSQWLFRDDCLKIITVDTNCPTEPIFNTTLLSPPSAEVEIVAGNLPFIEDVEEVVCSVVEEVVHVKENVDDTQFEQTIEDHVTVNGNVTEATEVENLAEDYEYWAPEVNGIATKTVPLLENSVIVKENQSAIGVSTEDVDKENQRILVSEENVEGRQDISVLGEDIEVNQCIVTVSSEIIDNNQQVSVPEENLVSVLSESAEETQQVVSVLTEKVENQQIISVPAENFQATLNGNVCDVFLEDSILRGVLQSNAEQLKYSNVEVCLSKPDESNDQGVTRNEIEYIVKVSNHSNTGIGCSDLESAAVKTETFVNDTISIPNGNEDVNGLKEEILEPKFEVVPESTNSEDNQPGDVKKPHRLISSLADKISNKLKFPKNKNTSDAFRFLRQTSSGRIVKRTRLASEHVGKDEEAMLQIEPSQTIQETQEVKMSSVDTKNVVAMESKLHIRKQSIEVKKEDVECLVLKNEPDDDEVKMKNHSITDKVEKRSLKVPKRAETPMETKLASVKSKTGVKRKADKLAVAKRRRLSSDKVNGKSSENVATTSTNKKSVKSKVSAQGATVKSKDASNVVSLALDVKQEPEFSPKRVRVTRQANQNLCDTTSSQTKKEEGISKESKDKKPQKEVEECKRGRARLMKEVQTLIEEGFKANKKIATPFRRIRKYRSRILPHKKRTECDRLLEMLSEIQGPSSVNHLERRRAANVRKISSSGRIISSKEVPASTKLLRSFKVLTANKATCLKGSSEISTPTAKVGAQPDSLDDSMTTQIDIELVPELKTKKTVNETVSSSKSKKGTVGAISKTKKKNETIGSTTKKVKETSGVKAKKTNETLPGSKTKKRSSEVVLNSKAKKRKMSDEVLPSTKTKKMEVGTKVKQSKKKLETTTSKMKNNPAKWKELKVKKVPKNVDSKPNLQIDVITDGRTLKSSTKKASVSCVTQKKKAIKMKLQLEKKKVLKDTKPATKVAAKKAKKVEAVSVSLKTNDDKTVQLHELQEKMKAKLDSPISDKSQKESSEEVGGSLWIASNLKSGISFPLSIGLEEASGVDHYDPTLVSFKRPPGRPRIRHYPQIPKPAKVSRHGKILGRPKRTETEESTSSSSSSDGSTSQQSISASGPPALQMSYARQKNMLAPNLFLRVPMISLSPTIFIDQSKVSEKSAESETKKLVKKEPYKKCTFRHVESSCKFKEIALKFQKHFVQIILISNTTVKNGLNPRVLKELKAALISCKKDNSCRVVLLNSVGNIFCSGVDLTYLLRENKELRQKAVTEMIQALKDFLRLLISFPKPIVVAVNGTAVGIGMAILPLCDIVYASDKATFYAPYAKLGQSPEGCASFMLPACMNLSVAGDILFGLRRLTAEEAQHHGLVANVFWPESLMEEVIPRVERMAAQNAQAMGATKMLMRQRLRGDLEAALQRECHLLNTQWCSVECQTAMKKFVETEEFI